MQVKAEFLPGWLIMLAIAVASVLISSLIVIGGANPVEATLLAILLGILVANLGLLPAASRPGVAAFDPPLIFGIVLIGAGLDVATVISQGLAMLMVIVGAMLIAFWAIYFLGRAFGLTQRLCTLLSVGTTICGTTAIAVTAPLIEAPEEETCYAVSTIALWGVVAMLAYPVIFRIVAPDADTIFGLFAGIAVQSTPQAVGAGFIFSELAGDIATAVKLVRNTFIAPVAFAVAIWYAWSIRAKQGDETVAEATGETVEKVNWLRGFPWFLFGYFVMVALRSYGFFTEVAIESFTSWGKFMILVGMAGIGLNTRFSAFKGIGGKPLLVGVIGAVILAIATLGLINALGIV